MKAVVWTQYGSPDGLQLQEINKPQPGENEILIKIHAASVTAGDCEMRRLELPLMLSFPMRIYAGLLQPKRIPILGQEFSGVVEQVGETVKTFQVGDEVFGTTGFKFGAYAEYICLPADPGDAQGMLTVKPANLTHLEATAVPTAGFEALHYLRRANIKPGDKVLIIGAGGSIGTIALQLAKMFGANVTVVDSTGKIDMLHNLGADQLIDYTKQDYLKLDQRFDIIIDVVGKRGVAKRLKLLKGNGYYFLAFARFSDLWLKAWVSITSKKKLLIESSSQSRSDLQQLKDLVEQEKFKPVIGKIFPLAETAEAHRYAESGKKNGNVVLAVIE